MRFRFLKKFVGKGITNYKPTKKIYEIFLKVIRPHYVKVGRYKLFIPQKRYFLSDSLFLLGEFEPNQTKIIKSLIKKGDIVIDIGANIGYYTILMSQLVGDKGKVYAFEPEEENIRLIEKSIKYNNIKNVILYPLALSDKDGEESFFINKVNMGGHSLIKTKESVKEIKMKIRKLDTLINEDKIKLIKMDTEGSEKKVLKGAKKLIGKTDPILIMEDGQELMQDKEVKKILEKQQYILFDIYDNLREKKLK